MSKSGSTSSAFKGETPEQLAAFEAYLAMGQERSLRKLAKKIGAKFATIQSWSRRNKWRDRLLELQEQAAEQAKEDVKKAFFENAENLKTYKYELLDLLKRKVDTSRYCDHCGGAPVTVSEIVKVYEVVKLELGEPTSIAKGQFSGDTPNPFAGIMEAIAARLNPDNADDAPRKK
jgi:cysteine synthase